MKKYIIDQKTAIDAIETCRKSFGMSIQWLTYGVCHPSTYYRWRNKEALISVDDYVKLCNRLDIDLSISTGKDCENCPESSACALGERNDCIAE